MAIETGNFFCTICPFGENGECTIMEIQASELDAEAAYRLLVGAIVPRPIAWVTTISPGGRVNAAPFSAFTFLSNKPPMVGVSIGRRSGVLKDTARNIFAGEEYVVNIADESLLDPLHSSAQEFPEDVSEVEHLALSLAPSTMVKPPRLAAAPVSLECRLHRALEFGDYCTNLFVGEVVVFHVRDDIIERGKIDSMKLKPIARLGGPNYAMLGNIVTKPAIYITPKA
jgi:flavin reductase (DIM6/NTAB) family NADH-FMN oxidoreductase RutF